MVRTHGTVWYAYCHYTAHHTAEQPESHAKSFDGFGNEAILELAHEYLEALMETEGLGRDEAVRRILDTDGFRFYQDIIETL